MSHAHGAIGIDIGGTKIAVAAVDPTGKIRAGTTFPTEAELGFARAMAQVSRAITETIQQAAWAANEFAGIGIGCAGPVDPLRGLINNPYTLTGWNHCDIVTPLREHFRVPVVLENDADAAALGESFIGAGQGRDPIVMLTFGTGIGGAAIVDGRIFRGVGGGHPELGHIPVQPGGPNCYCGSRGCLESIASGTAIGHAGREFGFKDSREVFAAALTGNEGARGIVDRAVQATGVAIWTILHTFMPQHIILGGGLMDDHYELFAPIAREQIRRATMLPPGEISVSKAFLGNDAGLVGAARLAFGQQLNRKAAR